jgi:hypothetical protein
MTRFIEVNTEFVFAYSIRGLMPGRNFWLPEVFHDRELGSSMLGTKHR